MFIFTAVLGLILIGIYFLLKKDKRLPPGPIKWPVLGNVVELFLADPVNPHLAISKLATKYGNIMTLGFGSVTTVVLSSYEAMKTVSKYPECNTDRFPFPYFPDRSFGKNLGIIFASGSVWSNVRGRTMSILRDFGYGKKKSVDQGVGEIADDFLLSMVTESQKNSGVYSVEYLGFAPHFLNTVWSFVGGYRFNIQDPKLARAIELGDQLMTIIGHNNPYNVFPFLIKWFPGLMKYKEHLVIHRETQEYFMEMIEDAKTKRSERLDSEPQSFIEVFLDKIDQHAGDSNTIYTYEQLVVILMDLFVAGSETTATALMWSLLFLVQNPNVQKKVRQEINATSQNGSRSLEIADLKKMHYTRATLWETLRVGNPVPVPPLRRTTADIPLGEYVIPKDTALLFNTHLIYQDKSYWGDPLVFRPERFFDESGAFDQTRADRVVAFGVGTRICFADSLGMDSFFIFLTKVLSKFELSTIPGKEPSAAHPISAMTVRPRPFVIKLTQIN